MVGGAFWRFLSKAFSPHKMNLKFSLVYEQYHCIQIREDKIIEKYTLEVALKFRVFQGLTLNEPWIESTHSSLKILPWPWKYCHWNWLEFQGISTLNLEKPWPLNSNFSLPWPWIENSKIASRTLKILD